MADLAVVLTVRAGSERLPGKCLAEVEGKPLVEWIIRRLKEIKGAEVILATTREGEDDAVVEVAEGLGVPVYRGDRRDVVGRVNEAVRVLCPDAKLVMRALGDMPFLATEVVERVAKVLLKRQGNDAVLWHLPPGVWPVYGAREFPYSREGWKKIFLGSFEAVEREHCDLWFHRNRSRFRILYHEPPPQVYFRNYRLEVDYEEDLALVREVAKGVGMLKPLKNIIGFLDENPEVAMLNRERVELTGPMSSYQYDLQRGWYRLMLGQGMLGWKGKWWSPLGDRSQPVFCHRGHHLLGYAEAGVLHTKNGEVQLEAGKVKCLVEGCGSSKIWEMAKARGNG